MPSFKHDVYYNQVATIVTTDGLSANLFFAVSIMGSVRRGLRVIIESLEEKDNAV